MTWTAWPVLLGYPAIGVSIVLAVLAWQSNRPWFAFTSAVLITPISYYLSGSPVIGNFAFVPVLMLLGFAMWLGRRAT